ncbi:hypothetical protein V6N13_016012 [Hibiscus sabdariffa]
MPSSFSRIDGTDDTLSCASSVGSCSGLGNNGLNLSPIHMTKGCENLEDYCSDADSYSERSCGEEGNSVSTSVELGTDFHRSELHAYQKALVALHASGPLTWEKEEKFYVCEAVLHHIMMTYNSYTCFVSAAYGINVEKYVDAFSENLMANVGGINTLLLKP